MTERSSLKVHSLIIIDWRIRTPTLLRPSWTLRQSSTIGATRLGTYWTWKPPRRESRYRFWSSMLDSQPIACQLFCSSLAACSRTSPAIFHTALRFCSGKVSRVKSSLLASVSNVKKKLLQISVLKSSASSGEGRNCLSMILNIEFNSCKEARWW